MQSLIITLDGPAGSGKSTVARQLAKSLGLEFLDTGAMYRGVSATCVERDIEPADAPQDVAAVARALGMRFDWTTDPPRLLVKMPDSDERDVTDRLRDHDVTSRVSHVASVGAVREVLVARQREIGDAHPRLVTEGRDQGSVVFPKANVKFYLDADTAVRARRRAEQLRQLGRDADEAAILKSIIERDRLDATRKDGPLICPDDAIRIDTSDMSLDAVLAHLIVLVHERAGDRLASSQGTKESVPE